jgi:lysyl-tRNA synthetase class 2
MSSTRLEEIIQNRLDRLAKLKDLGINPYPSKFSKSRIPVSKARESEGQEVSITGRIRRWREHGNVIFADLKDASGQIQLLFQKKNLESGFPVLKLFDIGDFLGVSGNIITTQAGEITVDVSYFELLSKSLRPIPDDWYGLKDEEERYRRRYLDLLLNEDLRKIFTQKALFWNSMRDYLLKKGFTEVETPVLENVFGGADANPFITHHNALDIDLYLRISMGELWQKRLMVAGMEKTFEIGRQFRNEGLSREHLQDYSQMEFYWAYANYDDGMILVEEMYKYIAKETFGKLSFQINDFEIDLNKPWARIDYSQTILEHTNLDIRQADLKSIKQKLTELKINIDQTDDRGRLIDYLWKHIRRQIPGPAFLVGHPVEVSPLAKRQANNTNYVERYQVIIAGSEMGNGYSELNDPVDQAERFFHQQELRDKGDTEAQMFDQDFVEALEFGMPPVTGFGVSERLFSFLANKPIRETVLFPLLRPEIPRPTTMKQDFEYKFVIVIDNKLPAWQIMNTSGHIAAFLGNKMDKHFDTGKYFSTKDGGSLPRNSQYPIITLSASSSQLKDLMQQVRDSGLLYIGYVPEMMETTNDKKLEQILNQKSEDEIQYTGIGFFGPKDTINQLTEKFSLWGKA